MPWNYQISDDYPSVTGFTHLSSLQKNNVDIIYSLWHPHMSDEAIAGILGNMDYESGLNPGQGEIGHNMSPQYGLGLIQWTPSGHIGSNPLQDYATGIGGDWWDGSLQANWILAGDASGSWIPTALYPYTWAEYCQLNNVTVTTRAYFEERERGTWDVLRQTYAGDWLNYIQSITPGTYTRYGGAREMLRRLVIHA